MTQAKLPALLLDPEQFRAWKDHPVTQEYHRFLRDRQTALATAWAEGRVYSVEAQAQAQILGRLASLSLEDVAAEYGVHAGE